MHNVLTTNIGSPRTLVNVLRKNVTLMTLRRATAKRIRHDLLKHDHQHRWITNYNLIQYTEPLKVSQEL